MYQHKRHRTSLISTIIIIVEIVILTLLAIALINHKDLEIRFDTIVNWLQNVETAIANLDSKIDILICVFCLYLAKCQLPIPMGILCVVSGLVFPMDKALIINTTFTIFLFLVKYWEGMWIGGGWAGMILNVKKLRFIREWIHFKGNGNPYVLCVCRLVPAIPIGMVSKYYGSMKYDVFKYVALSVIGFFPRLYIYTSIGVEFYNPFSAKFIILVMTIVGFSGLSAVFFNVYYGSKSNQMTQTLLIYSEKEKYKIVV